MIPNYNNFMQNYKATKIYRFYQMANINIGKCISYHINSNSKQIENII